MYFIILRYRTAVNMSIPLPPTNRPPARGQSAPKGKAPDAIGLAAAQAAQTAVAPDTVILFGSRARGDHRPDSDVDLLVICHGSDIHAAQYRDWNQNADCRARSAK